MGSGIVRGADGGEQVYDADVGKLQSGLFEFQSGPDVHYHDGRVAVAQAQDGL